MVKAIYSPSGQGTLDFMAAEVLHQTYQFQRKLLDADAIFLEEVIIGGGKIPFEHNYGHDVESLFWLAVFMLFFNEDVRVPPETEEIAAIHKKCSSYVFPGNMSATKANRTSLISNPKELVENIMWFDKSF